MEAVSIAPIVVVVEVLTVVVSSTVTLAVVNEVTKVVKVVAHGSCRADDCAYSDGRTGSCYCNCGCGDANTGTSTGIFYCP